MFFKRGNKKGRHLEMGQARAAKLKAAFERVVSLTFVHKIDFILYKYSVRKIYHRCNSNQWNDKFLVTIVLFHVFTDFGLFSDADKVCARHKTEK